jgi:hypothetical protein
MKFHYHEETGSGKVGIDLTFVRPTRMAYAVAWPEPPEATDHHLAVWERNLTLPVTPRRRFDWLYRHNPAGPGRLAVLETSNPGQAATPVGTAGYGARAFQVDGQARSGAVLADLAVDTRHRTAMPALMLVRELRRDVLARHELVYAFPNRQAAPLLSRLGYRKLGETRRFAMVLRHRRYLRSHATAAPETIGGERSLWRRLLSRLLSAILFLVVTLVVSVVLDLTRAGLAFARASRPAAEYRLDWLRDTDDRFDKLWREASRDYPLVGTRDAAFVRWRFLERPEGPLSLAALVNRRTGDLEGYAVVEETPETTHIRDIFCHAAARKSLVRLLSAALVWRGAPSISMRLCGAAPLVACLQASGFRERADRRTVLVDVGAPLCPDTDRILDPSRWYLTDADEDA